MLLSTETANIAADNGALSALAIARRRGYPVPQSITNAEAVVTAVAELANGQTPTAPSLPDHAKDVAKTVSAAAAARANADHVRQLSDELKPLAAQRVATLARQACEGWCQNLRETFDGHLTALRQAAPNAPRVNSSQLGDLNPDQFALWATVNASTLELDSCVTDRLVIATALRENYAHRDYPRMTTYIIAKPPTRGETAAMRQAHRDRIETFNAIRAEHDPVARWRNVLDAERSGALTIELARPGEAAARAEMFNTWTSFGYALQEPRNLADYLSQADNTYRTLTPAGR